MTHASIATLASAFVGRFALFLGLWWLVSDGRADGLVFGACFAAAAALVPSFVDAPRETPIRRPAPRGMLATTLRLPLLLPFFLWQSLQGGIDVALRAVRPRMPLEPGFLDYPLRLPPGPAQVVMAGLVSLMPGTLAVVEGQRLRVHLLDTTQFSPEDLARLEQLVACAFDELLALPSASSGRLE